MFGYSVKEGGDFLWTELKFTEVSKGSIKNLASTEEGRGFLGMLTKLDNFLSQGGNMMFGNEMANQYSTGRSIPSQNEGEGIDVSDLIKVFNIAQGNRSVGKNMSPEDMEKALKLLINLSGANEGKEQKLHPDDARIINDIEGILQNFAKDNSIDVTPERIIDSLDVRIMVPSKSFSSYGSNKKTAFTEEFNKIKASDTSKFWVTEIRGVKYKEENK